MCIGEQRKLTIPPDLGYGSRGIGPIPANAVLGESIIWIDLKKDTNSASFQGRIGGYQEKR